MSEAAKPYTLEDLRNWPPQGLDWSDAHVGLAVIGHPIAHSLSPVMHNAALAVLAKTNPEFFKWRYFKFDIEPKDLSEAIRVFASKNFRGLNLTVPHKTEVLKYVRDISTGAKEAGAANTLKLFEKRWEGFNTDGYGLRQALKDQSVEIKGSDVILLGAGGAARSAALECLVWRCASLRIQNRTRATTDALIAHLKKSTVNDDDIQPVPFDLGDHGLRANSVVINATSLGLKESDEAPLDLRKIPRPAFVFDMIYRPPQTRLLKQAAEMEIPHANGLSMLVHQGAESLEKWTGEKTPVEAMYAAVRSALN